MKKAFLFPAGILMVLFCLQASGGKQYAQVSGSQLPAAVSSQSPWVAAEFGKIPLQFIPNEGQVDGPVDFYIQGRDKTIYFTPEGLTFVLVEQTQKHIMKQPRRGESIDSELTQRWVVKLDFVDSNAEARPVGLEKNSGIVSYFKGTAEEWKAGIPTYSNIIYRELWPGIDLIYSGTYNQMKYEFIVHPGADPSRIKLAYRGADRVALTTEGRLEVQTLAGRIEDDNPIAYQEDQGEYLSIPVKYILESDTGTKDSPNIYGFALGEYDRNKTLILDPAMLVYCGYIGSAHWDEGCAITVDGEGNAYITGWSETAYGILPVIVGPDLNGNGDRDAFVAKVNSSGTELVYCGYIGGGGYDQGLGIAVDKSGNAYVTGDTKSLESSFPVTVGPDLTHNGGWCGTDAFVAKVNATGTALEYCGYIGGDNYDYAWDIDVDSQGNAYVTGETLSSEFTFPVAVGPYLKYSGYDTDAFIAKVNASGASLDYCGYIGGAGQDRGFGIALDNSGSAYITGITTSDESTFPVTIGPDLTFSSGGGFIAKVNAEGSGLVYCGYIDNSRCRDIAVDQFNNAYVTGDAEAGLPVTVGPDLTHNGNMDAFVAKVNATGTALDFCGYVGGADHDVAWGIAIDGSSNVFISGWTRSDEISFPVCNGPDMTHNGGLEDAFVAKIVAAGTSLEYCTYIGGSGKDWAWGIAADNSGNAYIVGYATSTEATFPVIVGPGLNHSGIEDAFVAKISHHAFYTFVGFDKPIENEPIVNSAKAGSSIPVKWQITEFDGTPVSDPASFKNLTSYSVNCGAFSVVLTDEVEEYSAGNSGLQYFEDGCWQFNWKTIKSYAGQCRIMVLKLADGSEHTAYFKFK